MKKVLYVATSDIHIKTFHIPYLKWLAENGCDVDLAVENRGNLKIPYVKKVFYLTFPRTPLSLTNISSYKDLKRIINENNYKIIHCHTPVPGVLTRLAARKTRKNGTKVLYTVHGFHFFKGARLINWLLYYPVEYLLSSFTDVIITMNKEDFNYVNGKMYHKESFLVPGVGVDSKVFYPFNENKILEERKKLGLNPDHFILLYVAEFIHRKNHKMIIDSIPVLKTRIPDIKILFAGKGLLLEKMKISVAEKGIDEHIIFLGFRNDINILSAISDVGISASRQEGLPVGLLQEMFCAKPVVAPYERGHNELIINKVNGFLFNQEDNQGFTECIFKLYSDKSLRAQMGMKSLERAQLFSVVNSLETMASIYRRYLQIRLI